MAARPRDAGRPSGGGIGPKRPVVDRAAGRGHNPGLFFLASLPGLCNVATIGQLATTLRSKDRSMSRLFVGNLSWDTTQDTLLAAFSAKGRSVKEVHIMTDRETGRPRGFAFVEMGSKADADAAIQELNGTNLDGRQIKVNEALERPQRPAGGGGGGGGFRGPRRDRR
jgi:RNA recognition motif-containing protein